MSLSTQQGLPSLSRLHIGCPAKRPRRGDQSGSANQPDTPNLSTVETDSEGNVVYVDLQMAAQNVNFGILKDDLVANIPSERILSRLEPINRSRLLFEIETKATLSHFSTWLRAALVSELTVSDTQPLGKLLAPLGPRLRLLGAHWIVPKATEYAPTIAAQTPHTDVEAKGEVVSIALNVAGNEMGTLIDACAQIVGKSIVNGSGFGRAATSVFGYDTGAVHGGPGIANVTGPYPKYFVERVFFLLCADNLPESRIKKHRIDNGLRGLVNLVIDTQNCGCDPIIRYRLKPLCVAMDTGGSVTLIFYKIGNEFWKEPFLNLVAAGFQLSSFTHVEIAIGDEAGTLGQMSNVCRIFNDDIGVELTSRTGRNPQYSYVQLGCSKRSEQLMLAYAKTLVGKPFSNFGMARSIVFPRQTDGNSFFCAELVAAILKKGGLMSGISNPGSATPQSLHRLYKDQAAVTANPYTLRQFATKPTGRFQEERVQLIGLGKQSQAYTPSTTNAARNRKRGDSPPRASFRCVSGAHHDTAVFLKR